MTEINKFRIRIKIILAFLILISLGLTFDNYNRLNKYGWFYEETRIINNEVIIIKIDIMNSTYFVIFFWVITLLALDLLILTDKLKF